jgi:hypothetical protein
MLCTHAGHRTISTLELMSTPLFRETAEAMKSTDLDRVTTFAPTEATGHGGVASGGDSSLLPTSSGGDSVSQVIAHQTTQSIVGGVADNPRAVMDNIVTVFDWIRTTFDALAPQRTHVIDVAENGAAIYKALTGMGLSRLWTSLSKDMEGGTTVTRDDFTKIFFEWMGIDEAFEAFEGGAR